MFHRIIGTQFTSHQFFQLLYELSLISCPRLCLALSSANEPYLGQENFYCTIKSMTPSETHNNGVAHVQSSHVLPCRGSLGWINIFVSFYHRHKSTMNSGCLVIAEIINYHIEVKMGVSCISATFFILSSSMI